MYTARSLHHTTTHRPTWARRLHRPSFPCRVHHARARGQTCRHHRPCRHPRTAGAAAARRACPRSVVRLRCPTAAHPCLGGQTRPRADAVHQYLHACTPQHGRQSRGSTQSNDDVGRCESAQWVVSVRAPSRVCAGVCTHPHHRSRRHTTAICSGCILLY